MAVTDGIISVEWAFEYDSTDAIEVMNAAGQLKLSVPGSPVMKYVTATLTLTGIDPDIYEMITGQTLVTDGQGRAVGINGEESPGSDFGAAIETWSNAGTDDGDCGTEGKLYGYFLLPYLVAGQIGDITLDDGAMDCVLTGRTKRGSQWGTGPDTYLVADAGATPGTATPAVLASAIGGTDHYRLFVTPVAPPDAACGAQELVADGT